MKGQMMDLFFFFCIKRIIIINQAMMNRTRIFLIACIILFLIIASLVKFYTKKEAYHTPLALEDIRIYAIHKKEMDKRRPRLEKMLQTYFSDNIVEITEPVGADYLRNNLSILYTSGTLSNKAYQDLLYNMMVHTKTNHGALTISSLSLYMTNLLIMEKESSSANYNYIMIVEDDILVRDGFDRRFRSILRHLPEDWDILYLACHFPREKIDSMELVSINKEEDFKIVRMSTRIHGTGALLYHPRALPKVLKMLLPLDLQIDHDIPDKLVLTGKLQTYIALTLQNTPLIHNDNQFYGSSTQTTDE